MRLERLIVIPDAHFPHVHQRAWRLLLKVCKGFRPKHLICLGDFIDGASVSAHDKNPNDSPLLDYEIETGNAALDQLDAIGAQNKVMLGSNHHIRVEKYLAKHAPALYNFVKLESLLRLKERGWKSLPYHQSYKLGKIRYCHDVGHCGQTSHLKSLATVGGSICHGHSHHLGWQAVGNLKGEVHLGVSLGWLGDRDKVSYISTAQAAKWALGFGAGHMLPDGTTFLNPIPIVNNGCVVDGRHYSVA